MSRAASLLGVAFVLVATWARAAEIAGVRFPDLLRIEGAELLLQRTALLRYRWVFEVYAAALYLEPGVPAHRLLHDVPRRFEIHYFYRFAADEFAQATQRGIEANVDAETVARLEPDIDAFKRLYRDVEPGDRYALTYVPGFGTELAHNGKPLGRVPGVELARAIFSIWFGERPFDEGMKRDLLGADGG